MKIESPLPAPLDLITFRITDINVNITIDILSSHTIMILLCGAQMIFLTHSKWLKNKVSAESAETHITTTMEFALLQERYGKEPSERLPRWKSGI